MTRPTCLTCIYWGGQNDHSCHFEPVGVPHKGPKHWCGDYANEAGQNFHEARHEMLEMVCFDKSATIGDQKITIEGIDEIQIWLKNPISHSYEEEIRDGQKISQVWLTISRELFDKIIKIEGE